MVPVVIQERFTERPHSVLGNLAPETFALVRPQQGFNDPLKLTL